MPDPSNPTSRVIDVLNFLAAHPTESFSLAEIARHVGLSNGSAHRILTTMASANFLSRDARRRTFSLGMAMVAIGQAAVEKHRGIEIARREIARLAVELNLQCSATAVVDGELLVLVKEGMPRSLQGLTRVGERRPLLPPLGLCHIAWSDEAAISSYVEQAAPYLSDDVRQHLLAAFPVIRRRGYAMCVNSASTSHSRAATVVRNQARDPSYWASVFADVSHLTRNEVQLFDPGEAGANGISHIAAPVFSPGGTVAFQLVITGLPTDLGTREIERAAERLCATAASITNETHGRAPQG